MIHKISKDAHNPADVQQKHQGQARQPCRTSAEAAVMFGYASQRSLVSAVTNGCFPLPDFVSGVGVGKRKRLYWHLDTLQKEQKRRAAL